MPPSFSPLYGFGLGEGCTEVECNSPRGIRKEKAKVTLVVFMSWAKWKGGGTQGTCKAGLPPARQASLHFREASGSFVATRAHPELPLEVTLHIGLP